MKNKPINMQQPRFFTLATLLISALPIWAHNGPDFVPVTTTADSGPGSLRHAIALANDDAESQIAFQIATTDAGYNSKTGTFTIEVLSQLPPIEAEGTVVDGLAQTLINDSNKTGPEIIISGRKAPQGVSGLRIVADKCEVKGISIVGFPMHGIVITGETARKNRVQSNLIAKNKGCGVVISNGASKNWIGIAPPPEKEEKTPDEDEEYEGLYLKEQGNLFSGNGQDAVRVSGFGVGNSIRGNNFFPFGKHPINLRFEGEAIYQSGYRTFNRQGPNNGQPAPVIVKWTDSKIYGTAQGAPSSSLFIEIYSWSPIQARMPLDYVTAFQVETDNQGNAKWETELAPKTLMQFFATATGENGTSEMSAPYTVKK